MELSNKVVQVRSTLKPDVEEYPSFSPHDVILLFGDVAKPVGLVLNHNNLRECFVICPDSEYVTDILKLADTPKWVGTHMNLTIDRPRVEIIPIIVKLLEDKASEEEEEYEFIPIEELVAKGSAQFSTPRKGEEPVAPQLAEQIKSLQTAELKQILAAISQEIDARQVPNKSPSKPENASLSQAHEVSSILHSLIKEGALRTNIPKLSVLAGRSLRERHPLSSGPMNYRPSGRLTVSQP